MGFPFGDGVLLHSLVILLPYPKLLAYATALDTFATSLGSQLSRHLELFSVILVKTF